MERMSNSSQKLLGGSHTDGFRDSISSRSRDGEGFPIIPSLERDGLLGVASHVLNSKVLNRFQNGQKQQKYPINQDIESQTQSQSSSRRSFNDNQKMPLASNKYINEYQNESSRLNSQRHDKDLKYNNSLSSQRGYNYTDSNTKREMHSNLENIRERTTQEMLNYQLPNDRETLENS